MRRFAIGLTLLSLCAVARADPETDIRASIDRAVAEAWRKNDYTALDQMAEGYWSTRAKTLSGKWRLTIYSSALSSQLEVSWPKQHRLSVPGVDCECMPPDPRYYARADELWSVIDKKTQDWMTVLPNSPHAVAARAQYLMNRAWFYRGTAYAQYVTTEAWSQLKRYEGLAQEVLQSHRGARLGDPDWFVHMFRIASDLSWSADSVNALTVDFEANGQFYPEALVAAFIRLQPKWGGSISEMDRFARQVTERTRAQEGGEMYTRLYWNLVTDFGHELFTDGGADWPMMRAGFQDMIKRYPDPRNLNALAIFACMAGDFETMDQALQRLVGDKVQPAGWTSYDVRYDECLSLRDTAKRQPKGPDRAVKPQTPVPTRDSASIRLGRTGRIDDKTPRS